MKGKQHVCWILVMTMVLGSALSGNTVAATEEDQDRDGSVKVFLNVDTENSLNQDTLHKVNISAENSTDTETMLRLYLKNDGGSAAEDIEAVDLQKSLKNAVTLSDGSQTSLNAEWKVNRDDNGKARSKYLQAAMPAESSLDFDVHLQYRTDESNYTKKVLVEAKAFEGEQEVTETSDSEDGNKENEVTLVWADEQAATGTEGTEAAGTESTEAAAQNAVSATASLDSKYVYLDPEGMNLSGTDWKNKTVWLFVNNDSWTTKFMEGTYDSSNGYYKWPSGDWSNTDCDFFFTLSNDWNTIKMNDYYRTDVVPKIKLNQAAGKVFIQNGTASDKINGRSVYAVKEKSDSGETPDPSGDYRVYYDATLSKLSYAKSGVEDNSIPKDGELRYRAWNNTNDTENGKLQKVKDYTKGTNKWTDVYVASLKKKYKNVLFYGGSSFPDEKCARKTENLTIPWNTVTKPCFYADSSDDAIYGQINRNGYWDSVYKIRDAEKGKAKDVVDIQNGKFSRKSDTLYVDSTFYDYYTDYELNGNNRDNYGGDNRESHRNWVNFRQFDQALSDYYNESKVKVPIYTGHFQPSNWGYPFSDIAYTLNLYGFDEDNQNPFMSTNNSALDVKGNGGKYACAAQGLVAGSLKNNKLLTSDAKAEEPHFNEAFLQGKNSKNAVLGQVYHNVSFPFKKEDRDNNGVNYWCFDSKKTTLAMRQDTEKNTYYLEDTGNKNWSQNVNSSSGTDGVSHTYGFFPFNETSQATSAKNYNYGFGTRMDMTFKLTDDGTIIDKNGKKVPIEFKFSGDDDVWVYIDGKLALDVGGEHGKVTGKLDFKDKSATVSNVKASAGSPKSGDNVTSDFTLSGSNSDEHTLTLFYMERGMWESNMKITFNFPDENEFAVEKKVDTTAVNKNLFPDSLFDNTSVFPFTIMNQATHYGTKATNSQIAKLPKVYNDSFDNSTLSKNEVQNTFEHTAVKAGQSNVVHWRARQNDTTGSYIGKRVGIIAPAAGKSTFDASETNAFLQFKMYYDYLDTPALADTYVALTDSAGNEIGGYLSGKTYGISSLSGKKWNTVKVDLSKLQGNKTFDYSKITAIKFDYNYERDIYLDDFTFIPSVILTGKTGFVTEQYEIPDYGSAKSGRLEYPKDAQYTVSKNNKKSQTYRLEDDGTFALADGETATFHDQFRRGSYISVKEAVDPDVFDTSWTLYENGEAVTDMKKGSTVENTSPGSPSVKDVNSIRDGRKEVYREGFDSEGQRLNNIGYTETDWAKDQNGSEDQNTIVFRSYLDPDNTISSTKLKAVFVNKVKTGKIIIYKRTAEGSPALEGNYSFKVEFKDIAGLSLENKAIEKTYTCKAGGQIEIDGIPAGTNYRIWEITPEDGSTLESVTVKGNNSFDAGYDPVTKVVAGKVIDSTETLATEITFNNTLKPTLNICLKKNWDKVTGLTLPDSIQIQLQRSCDGGKHWEAMDYEGRKDGSTVITLRPDYDGYWKYTFENLERYVDYKAETKIPYQYRVVEVDKDGNVITEGGYLNDVFKVNYSPVIDGSSVPDGSEGAAAKTENYTITNTYSPKTNIKIKKQDASTKNPLNGAEFKLEKLKDDGNKNWIVDEGFPAVIQKTDGKDSNNKELGTAIFSDLEDGTYRLTEIKASSDHNLLKDPITIVINRNEKSLVDNEECEIVDNTIMITISNQSKFHLPATGGYGRYLVILGGLALAGAALLRYKLQNRRKDGKHSE